MLKENFESSCGTPDIIGPYVYKTQLECINTNSSIRYPATKRYLDVQRKMNMHVMFRFSIVQKCWSSQWRCHTATNANGSKIVNKTFSSAFDCSTHKQTNQTYFQVPTQFAIKYQFNTHWTLNYPINFAHCTLGGIYIPCCFHEFGTMERQAIYSFLVQQIFDFLVAWQERALYIPSNKRAKNTNLGTCHQAKLKRSR